jgi:hypothetical protein
VEAAATWEPLAGAEDEAEVLIRTQGVIDGIEVPIHTRVAVEVAEAENTELMRLPVLGEAEAVVAGCSTVQATMRHPNSHSKGCLLDC